MEGAFRRVVTVSERLIKYSAQIKQARNKIRINYPQIALKPIVSTVVASVCVVPVVHAAFSFNDKITANCAGNEESSNIAAIKLADELYVHTEVDRLYDHLKPYAESTDPDLMWRLARATCDKAKSSTDAAAKKELMYEAFGYAEKALVIGDNHFACHKWYAIMLDYIGEYQATKERISKAYHIKEHFLRAIELNPKDATSIHLLGYWCFVFADLPWYQQKIAAVVFATPPSSSYDEALKYFLDAEQTDPGFYSMNLLMIGKTYLRLKDNEKAEVFLKRANEYPVRTEDDKRAHKESTELLQTLGIK